MKFKAYKVRVWRDQQLALCVAKAISEGYTPECTSTPISLKSYIKGNNVFVICDENGLFHILSNIGILEGSEEELTVEEFLGKEKWQRENIVVKDVLKAGDPCMYFHGSFGWSYTTYSHHFSSKTSPTSILYKVGPHGSVSKVLPYTADTRHLLGTLEDAPSHYIM